MNFKKRIIEENNSKILPIVLGTVGGGLAGRLAGLFGW